MNRQIRRLFAPSLLRSPRAIFLSSTKPESLSRELRPEVQRERDRDGGLAAIKEVRLWRRGALGGTEARQNGPCDGGGAFVAFVSLFDVWRARVRHVQLLQRRVRPSHVRWRAAARREAWLWLIAEAAWQPRTRFIGPSRTKVSSARSEEGCTKSPSKLRSRLLGDSRQN